jgi:hypothetical protein
VKLSLLQIPQTVLFIFFCFCFLNFAKENSLKFDLKQNKVEKTAKKPVSNLEQIKTLYSPHKSRNKNQNSHR